MINHHHQHCNIILIAHMQQNSRQNIFLWNFFDRNSTLNVYCYNCLCKIVVIISFLKTIRYLFNKKRRLTASDSKIDSSKLKYIFSCYRFVFIMFLFLLWFMLLWFHWISVLWDKFLLNFFWLRHAHAHIVSFYFECRWGVMAWKVINYTNWAKEG